MKKPKYLIIGGSGFIGTRLIELIGHENCINLDKNKSHFFNKITSYCDITIKESIKIPKSIKTIILLAAEHKDNITPFSLYYDVNVKGTKNVLKKMNENGIKNLIFTSSVAVYGLNKKNPSEKYKIDPFNHYGKSKFLAELEIKKWYDEDKLNKSITIIRPCVVFGERNRGNVYNLFNQIYSGKFLMIGNGKNKKSMAYVGNVSSFILNRMKHLQSGFNIYNYSDKPDYNMNDLVKIIEKNSKSNIIKIKIPYIIGYIGAYLFDLINLFLTKKLPITSTRIKKFCATTQFDSSKAMRVFKPNYTLSDGIKRTLNFEFSDPKKDEILFYSE